MKQMTILLITLFSIGCGSNSEPVEVEDATAFVATVYTYAVMLPDGDDRSPNPRPEPECPCNGTGQIRHGDGHVTECPCGSSCSCPRGGGDQVPSDVPQSDDDSNTAQTPSNETEAVTEATSGPSEVVLEDTKTPDVSNETPATAKRQILVFTATWCGPCQALKGELAKMKSVGWRIGSEKDASIRIIDFDTNKSLAQQMGVKGLPTLIKLEDGVQVGSHEGYLDAFGIGRLYQGQ